MLKSSLGLTATPQTFEGPSQILDQWSLINAFEFHTPGHGWNKTPKHKNEIVIHQQSVLVGVINKKKL